MPAPSLINHDYSKHRGVRQTKSGKWGAAILHPITKVSVWLGSYNTPKEAAAADAYIKKRLEFDSMATNAATVQEESNVYVTETEKAPSVETTSPNNADYSKHRGVRHTKSGKWGAAIQHPLVKVSVWLGSYNTPKEAADAYIKKKLEFDSMIKDATTVQKAEKALTRTCCEPKLMDQATDSSYSPSITNQRDYTMHRGVRRTQSGKWGAAIRHPFTKVSVWLGSYNTPKEAADAYIKKKLEFDSLVIDAATVQKAEKALTRTCCEPKLMDQADMNCEESNLHVTENVKAPSVENRSPNAETELVSEAGISKVKVAGMDDECRGSQVNVESIQVSCPSGESNENFDMGAINAFGELVGELKREDLDYMSPVEAVVTKELDPICGSKRTRKQEMSLTESVNEQVTCSRPHGVYQRKSGKLCAEIRNPMTKLEYSADSYETTEEVIEVANRKMHEYPEMKKHKQSNVETELVSNSQDIVSEAGISSVKVADSDDEDGGSQVSVDSIQVPLSAFVTNQEFDTSSVVIAYGELVGEFSRLDDELWLDV